MQTITPLTEPFMNMENNIRTLPHMIAFPVCYFLRVLSPFKQPLRDAGWLFCMVPFMFPAALFACIGALLQGLSDVATSHLVLFFPREDQN